MDPRIIVIAAVAENNIIGDAGKIPWRLPADVNRFKTLTTGHTVIMGRRTWESLHEKYRPLPGRHNIVLTNQRGYSAPGAVVFGSLAEALANSEGQTVFIMGGRQVYAEALPLAHELHLTIVHAQPLGDTLFPPMKMFKFTETDTKKFPADGNNNLPFAFSIFRRSPPMSSPVYLANARKPEQWANMERIELDGVCPFCPVYLSVYHTPPVIAGNDHWVATENQWPYDNTRHHYLLITTKHCEKLGDISGNAWSALGALVTSLEQELAITGGALVLRFGDPATNRGTVRHLHFHLVSADSTDPDNKNYQPVQFRVG